MLQRHQPGFERHCFRRWHGPHLGHLDQLRRRCHPRTCHRNHCLDDHERRPAEHCDQPDSGDRRRHQLVSDVGREHDLQRHASRYLPAFHQPPTAERAVSEGDAVTFTVAANPEAPLLRYQWRLNGTNIAGAIAASLALTKVQVSAVGSYSVRITNQFGAATSSNAVLAVNRFPIAQCADVLVSADANCLAQASSTGAATTRW